MNFHEFLSQKEQGDMTRCDYSVWALTLILYLMIAGMVVKSV